MNNLCTNIFIIGFSFLIICFLKFFFFKMKKMLVSESFPTFKSSHWIINIKIIFPISCLSFVVIRLVKKIMIFIYIFFLF